MKNKNGKKKNKMSITRTIIFDVFLLLIGIGFMFSGIVVLWISSFKIPTLESFEERKITESSKIYDRTGEVLLYDVFEDIKRTVVPFDEISPQLKNATIAIEDRDFYNHNGIKISSIARAILANMTTGSYGQGGSTITQQVVKLSLLTTKKDVSRKLKEWVLAVKLDKMMSKDEILNYYLNEIPYGGTLYGAEEASMTFFRKEVKDINLAEAAYLASLPQAPSYYSPYGKNREALDNRKNLVLLSMKDLGYITNEEYETAKNEKVVFAEKNDSGIKAPHFVFYVKELLENKYGEGIIESGGLKIITTLDYEMQKKAEDTVKKYAIDNAEKNMAENASLVAIDPKTGQILAMVGSRDYHDKEIDGKFNVATSKNRQPGSTFKPFVYAESFNKGYTPETILFDTETVFTPSCPLDAGQAYDGCYAPNNYDGNFRGPITVRSALAQSINIPAIKMLYLVGVNDVLVLAKKMGITGLNNADQYGLTLALGGGEVSLVDMTGAFGVFANEGQKNTHTPILEVRNRKGDLLEQYNSYGTEVLPKETARKISSILSDNKARAPMFGERSLMYFPNYDVAVKTGTTNDYKDAWVIGYTPNVVVGAWAGNNDSTSMDRQVANVVITPLWNAFMNQILPTRPKERFEKPAAETDLALKPILRGKWNGGKSVIIDTFSGLLASPSTPIEARGEILTGGIHDILHWVDKNNPRGDYPNNPMSDSQYTHWEYGVQKWLTMRGIIYTEPVVPTETSGTHNQNTISNINILSPQPETVYDKNSLIQIQFVTVSNNPIKKADFYLNDQYIGSSESSPFLFSFIPSTIEGVLPENKLKIIVTDTVYNRLSREFVLKTN